MNLSTATPVEIDTEWAPLAAEQNRLWSRLHQANVQLDNAEALLRRDSRSVSDWDRRRAERVVEGHPDRIAELVLKLDEAQTAQAPYRAEWCVRGGWTRAYLVVSNGQGHVHRSTSCSTCYPTTQFVWLTDLSGADEQEIVDQAGERACTVCYASAPVELRLDRPTRLFSEDEKASQRAREARAAARKAKDAAKVYDAVTGEELFKTERGATNAISSYLGSLCWYGETHPSAAEWKTAVEQIIAALVAKGSVADADEFYTDKLAKARKRTEADQRKAKAEAVLRGYDKLDGYRDEPIGSKF